MQMTGGLCRVSSFSVCLACLCNRYTFFAVVPVRIDGSCTDAFSTTDLEYACILLVSSKVAITYITTWHCVYADVCSLVTFYMYIAGMRSSLQ